MHITSTRSKPCKVLSSDSDLYAEFSGRDLNIDVCSCGRYTINIYDYMEDPKQFVTDMPGNAEDIKKLISVLQEALKIGGEE